MPGWKIVGSFDCSLDITESAKSLLAHLRDTENFRELWIDAICINQEDEVEKTQQVNLMADIYSRASKVIVWLGEADDKTNDAFEAMKILAHMDVQNASRHPAIEQARSLTGFFPWHLPHEDPFFLSKERWSAFQWLLQRPWFTRTWIFQEIVQARRAVVRCGDYEAPWKLLERACEVATTLEIPPLYLRVRGGIGALSMPSIMLQIPRFREKIQQYRALQSAEGAQSTPGKSQVLELLDAFDLDALVIALRNQNSSDPRDKVFGVYSLCLPDISCEWLPRPDYRLSAREVYIKMAKYWILNYGSVSLQVLSFVESFDSREAWPGVQGLPSWVPDWSRPISRELISYAALCDATPGKPSMALVVEDCHEDQTPRATTSATEKQKIQASPELQQCCHCLKLTGVRVLQIHHIYETKLSKAMVAHLNTLPAKYPTTDLTYPEVYPRIVEPSRPEHFQVPTAHHQKEFWETLTNFNNEDDKATVSVYTKDDFKKFLSAEQRVAHIILGLDTRGMKSGRKVCITNGGFMGLAPSNALVGDEVALLWGAAIPYWIRKDGNHYKLVGEAYVYGIMGGEVMEDLDESRVEEFLIC
ncbi:heterokaryon incompatibility protein-domain-containing protein [Echria macrotheca]|uniref:Heterokaryon incompatibility protein-domain-containing protein n=1 Tax=Echria macrotheca TaxID=438768 RepID=A0AAJ0BEU4_9PEZI|nr:heterokaryon incompatibility protein-domain-containing protein [Echria macrotheca]